MIFNVVYCLNVMKFLYNIIVRIKIVIFYWYRKYMYNDEVDEFIWVIFFLIDMMRYFYFDC